MIPFLVSDPETLNEILYKLRIETWVSMGVFNEGEFKPEDFVDEHDHHAYHWAIKDDSKVIAAARMCVHNYLSELPDANFFLRDNLELKSPIASINRLALYPSYQKNGFSRLLDKIRIEKAIELGCKSVIGVAPSFRMQSLIDQGFQLIGTVNKINCSEWIEKVFKRYNSEKYILKKDLS